VDHGDRGVRCVRGFCRGHAFSAALAGEASRHEAPRPAVARVLEHRADEVVQPEREPVRGGDASADEHRVAMDPDLGADERVRVVRDRCVDERLGDGIGEAVGVPGRTSSAV